MASDNNNNREVVTQLSPIPSPPEQLGKPIEEINEEWPRIISSAIILFFIFILSWWLNGVL